MGQFSYINNANPAFIEELYQQYQEDKNSVDESWRVFFEGYEFSQIKEGSQPAQSSKSTTGSNQVSDKEVAVVKMIHGYRSRGHLIAQTNPVRERRHHKSDLDLSYFGLNESDMDTVFQAGNEIKIGPSSLRQISDHLHQTYCARIGVEFMYCRNEKLRQWLYNEMETCANKPYFSNQEKRHILNTLDKAVSFESFLHTKYIGKKRFSLEGLEVFIPCLDAAIRQASKMGIQEVNMGMAHRGRLNVLVNIFEKSYETVFAEFEDQATGKEYERGGDVKYHLGKSADIKTIDGHPVHLSLVFNPSHLEAIGSVMQGIVYAKQQDEFDGNHQRILPILVHGDSAMSGQGINYELANLSKVDGYGVGGTLHFILNNQVGFTANYRESRSSVYCTDLAKVTESPVFHVNADDPLAVVHAVQMAIKIRQQFAIDVYIDILGYRRYGHNEGDEPRFTQPLLYKGIAKHPNVYDLFLNELVASKDISNDEASKIRKAFKDTLNQKLEYARANKLKVVTETLQAYWKGYRMAVLDDFEKSIETGVPRKSLNKINTALSIVPDSFHLFPKMKRIIEARKKLYETNQQVDWALAEQLAFGSLLIEGNPVRLSGQDSQRGTFSHRHAVIKDFETEHKYVPMNHIQEKQAELHAYNSILSEYCVSGFEYGFSLAQPNALSIWEAQFGDFANGAQIIIDQFISSSEYKWQRMSGLVLLLPHGYEGQGPEHSSARFERFLQMCAEENMYVVNITTPANLFHAFRRQVKNPFRKPMVVMSPKSLLRHPKVVSPVSELVKGQFKEIIDDADARPSKVKRVVMCTGKLYYDLLEKKEELKDDSVALVRFEQLYPLPKAQLSQLRTRYNKAEEWIWAQEEPENMGAWNYILRTLRDWQPSVIARLESASPATGSNLSHRRSQKRLIERVFKANKKTKSKGAKA